MRRRTFITLLGGAAAWPLVARAQQRDRMRRIGVLMLYAENDPEGRTRATALQQGLERLGWTAGRNLAIDYHWGTGDDGWTRSAVAELLRHAPDVLLANGGPALRAAQQTPPAVATVFIGSADPVAEGFVQSLARPGGNFTGFTTLEPSVGAKFLELLTEIAPRVVRVALMFNPGNSGSLQLSESLAAAAQKFGVQAAALPVRSSAEIETAMAKWRGEGGDGLIIPPDPTTNTHRKLIVDLAARYRLPTVYALRSATAEGGLISYGIDIPDLFRKAAEYVDRILRGEKPADLPVQRPTKFELVINLKTARALGLEVPPSLLARADEVIE